MEKTHPPEQSKRFRRPRIMKPLLGAAVAAALLIGADAATRPWLRPTGPYSWVDAKRTWEGGLRIIPDPVLGYIPAPGQSAAALIHKLDGRVLSSAVYSIDRHSRRITPGQQSGRRDRPLLFFGCSFTFGFGVDDDQTLPHDFARLAPAYRVYNYALLGYGPQNMLARLKETDIRSEIPETGKAVAVYVFIDDHVRRAIGSMTWTATSQFDLPYYFARSPSGDLTRRGTFDTGRPVVTALYRLAAKSAVVRHFAVEFPPETTDAHLELTARMIAESRDAFKEKFGSDEFYVLFFPEVPDTVDSRLAPMLRARGIRSLEYDA
ncbi:MAG: hypothetical protein ACHQ2Z_15200, partial [Elusimicrobiota bacterium]